MYESRAWLEWKGANERRVLKLCVELLCLWMHNSYLSTFCVSIAPEHSDKNFYSESRLKLTSSCSKWVMIRTSCNESILFKRRLRCLFTSHYVSCALFYTKKVAPKKTLTKLFCSTILFFVSSVSSLSSKVVRKKVRMSKTKNKSSFAN